MSYLKKIADVDLSRFDHGVSEYHQGWESCDQYAYDVMMGKIIVGKRVKHCIARYIYDRTKRKDIDFRTDKINHVIRFANLLRHVKGPLANKPVKLMMWMIFVLGNIYGWYYNSGSKKGRRRFTKAFTLVARGNAKSFLCSIVALYTQLTSPNGSPSCYSVARNRDQARIVFDDAKKMLRTADIMLRRWFDSRTHDMSCVLTDSTFKPMSQDNQSLDGYRVALGIADELHAHHNSELLNTLITGTSATVDPLIFCISTAGIQLDGVCVHERNLVRQINEGEELSDEYFGIEYSLDNEEDWDDEDEWCKANPSLGHAVQIDILRGELVRAKQSPTNRKNFLTKYCNIFVNTNNNPYLDILEVQKCAHDISIADYIGKDCFLGLDLAQKRDLCSLAILFPEDDGRLTAFFKNYIPQLAVEKSSPAAYERYTNWSEEDGCLVITDGKTTDFERIKDDIRMCAKYFNLIDVGYDPYAAGQLALEMERENIPMTEVRQSYAQMSEPAKLLEALIADEMYCYSEDDKCFEWCASNAAVQIDKNENIMVCKAKDKPHDKVDPIIALITGLALAKLKEPKTANPYKKRGLIVI